MNLEADSLSFINFAFTMIPAEVKKRENIAEYIIYMYQTEDLIHTYGFNLNEIYDYVIKHMSKDETKRKEILLWYANIIEQMQAEQISNADKRLKSTQGHVEELTSLHAHLTKSDNEYKVLYAKVNKAIDKHISLSGNTITKPVQICLNGLYGMLLLNLNGKKISPEQKAMLTDFGAVLGFLSKVYKKQQDLK